MGQQENSLLRIAALTSPAAFRLRAEGLVLMSAKPSLNAYALRRIATTPAVRARTAGEAKHVIKDS